MGVIFLQLLNRSITAGWLILAVLCVRLLFRKMPKWVNCLLWGVVAVRLIFPFSIESAFSLQPSAKPIRSSTVVRGEILPYVPSLDSDLSVVENTVNPILAEKFAYSEAESVAPLQVFTEIAGIVWVVGMIILLAFALGSMFRLLLLVKESVRYKNDVYICDRVKSPFILGIIRPRIYLSSSLTEEETEFILAHEKAHLKRKDHLWKPFGYLLLSIYWFNPLCLVAYIMLCKDIELACDEKVIMDMNFEDKKEYSKVLLSCATQRRLIMACPLSFGEVGVKERVKTVLSYKKPTFWITIAAIVVCAIIAICFLTNPEKEYQIRITIPAGSTEAFCYSDEEIRPNGNTLVLASGDGLGDTAVLLKPIKVKEENSYDTYEPTYMTPGMPVKMDVEKGAWFKIGVNMQNPTAEDIDVYVTVRGVEVRIASKTKGEYDSNEENAETQNSVTSQNLEQPQEPMWLEEEQTPLPFEGQGEKVDKPIAQTAMVDTSVIASIVVTNGNTGEKITITGEDTNSQEYYNYQYLLKLYSQLDFEAECAENARVGYQYSMKLQDAEGNKLQSVTPYKDGLTVDSLFYQYGIADNGADASLRLMEYLEYIFYPEKSSMAMPFNEVPVNTLPDVTMMMFKYKNYEGDIEITNRSNSELQTGEWFCIQKWEEESWHRLDELIDGVWKEVAYRIPAGETAVLQTGWKTWFGELPPGKYRIIKEVYVEADRTDTHYLSAEFEIKKSL